jgi:NAD(P) transhydrogenase subunit alpha
MAPGSVIVDLAADGGGNCELTKLGEIIVSHGVTIHGPENLSSTVPYHASQMYAKNVATFLLHLVKKGEVTLDMNDEITKETMMTQRYQNKDR